MKSRLFRGALTLFALVVAACLAGPARCQGPLPPPGKPAIIEFARPLCPICKEMEGILLEVKARYRDHLEIRFAYIEPDEYLFKKFRISIVPSQVFLDASGQEVFRHEGLLTKEALLDKLRELRFIKE